MSHVAIIAITTKKAPIAAELYAKYSTFTEREVLFELFD
jgi:hypothetical protein